MNSTYLFGSANAGSLPAQGRTYPDSPAMEGKYPLAIRWPALADPSSDPLANRRRKRCIVPTSRMVGFAAS
jgi:hypothetical protein